MMDGMEGAKCTTLGSCFLPLVMAAHGAPWSCTAHFPVHTSHPRLHSMSFLATSPLPAAPLHPVPSSSPYELPDCCVLVARAVPWRTTPHCVA